METANDAEDTMERTRLIVLTALLSSGLPAQFLPYGDGCAGPAGRPRMSRPHGVRSVLPGRPCLVYCDPLPRSAPAFLMIGFQKRLPGIDLTVVGMPGCRLYQSAEIALPIVTSGGTASATLSLPGFPCYRFHAQVAALDPAANALGVITSDAATFVVDSVSDTLLHRAVGTNTSGNSTYLDHPSLTDEPNMLAFVTPVWNPGGTPNGVYDPHEIGVYYSRSRRTWAVFNQDRAPMPAGAAFHVFLPSSSAYQLVVTADAGNTNGHRVVISNPNLDGDPNAHLQVTQNYNPGNQGAVYNDAAIGVFYNGAQWEIFNEDRSPMPAGASFNVLVVTAQTASIEPPFVHRATASNSFANYTRISHRALDGNPDARLIVTQHWAPPGGRGIYNPHPIGVFYDPGTDRWAIFNQDHARMPADASFNVLISEADARGNVFVHDAVASNTSAESTFVSDPRLDGDPSAIVFTTPNWNPNGTRGIYNDHATGVWYLLARGRWGIFNQDRAAMPLDASFNVLVPNSGATCFRLDANASNTVGDRVVIDHPEINGNRYATVFVEQIWGNDPPGASGVYNDHPVGVGWDVSSQRWNVRNLDGAPMPAGAGFFVLIADDNLPDHYVTLAHAANAGNTSLSRSTTVLDHPEINGRPDARILVTQSYNTGGLLVDRLNPHPIGVFYNRQSGRWAVFNQDRAAFQLTSGLGPQFFVMIDRGCR